MNYGIGNVKVKSSGGGGGGIPVITLQASQMISQTQIQFTEEQYNTIVNNGAFYLDLLGSQQLLMTCVNASNLADIQCYNISQTGSGLQLATIDLNKTTYIGVLGISPYPQAKQLYQHNINFGTYSINIFNDIPTKLTFQQIYDFLNGKGYTGYNNTYTATGTGIVSGSLYQIFGVFATSNVLCFAYRVSSSSQGAIEIPSHIYSTSFDTPIAL